MDPRDTSWLDAEEEDQDTRVAVKTIKSVVRNNRGSRRALDPSMEDVEVSIMTGTHDETNLIIKR